jgi:hypothetical protein|tara:strand:- start:341 stop:1075 length:735 start_codon:yes stop_codon:yes gene_type:complete
MSTVGRNFNWKRPFGPSILQTTISDELCDIFLSVGNRIRKDKLKKQKLDSRKKLAGNLSEEYGYSFDDGKDLHLEFSKKQLEIVSEELKWLASQYTKLVMPRGSKDPFSDKPNILEVEDIKLVHPLWINYMKQGEWNPIHNHLGLISCVMYLKVPKEIREENDPVKGTELSKKSNTPTAGKIEFSYGSHMPFSKSGITYTPKEKDVYFFPAKLTHQVYPFTSKTERISVSCNFKDIEDTRKRTW